jgi:Cysteine-rich CPXCG
MNTLLESHIDCPYCGERIPVLIDRSVEQQQYIEDCHVCCRPINFTVNIDTQGEACVFVSHEDE